MVNFDHLLSAKIKHSKTSPLPAFNRIVFLSPKKSKKQIQSYFYFASQVPPHSFSLNIQSWWFTHELQKITSSTVLKLTNGVDFIICFKMLPKPRFWYYFHCSKKSGVNVNKFERNGTAHQKFLLYPKFLKSPPRSPFLHFFTNLAQQA